ncbi:chromate efflux transporter [Segetibacter sp. 3557_3]|uniref:chromate efflux transporter n=1 Tax=Segetibacter sp. 3557_3 TaxID=2547429 RepID=UPI0010591618|nr:chromate efflux transporter [Segetibacter sp. 3557_3]TDH28699.1 chromate efflux transporter [Segetibacter sp. 3557_3]
MGQDNTRLGDIARLFLKLGVIGFGGPAVHIAMMEEEVVRKRGWMSHQHFLDLVGATSLIPGPNSTEMTMHIGHERGGWKGLVVAGSCFIIPAVVITALFAWAYQLYGQLPQVQPFIYGIKPAIIAVIVVTMINLGKKALKNVQLAILGALSAIAVLAGLNEIFVLFGAGLVGILLYFIQSGRNTAWSIFPFTLFQIGYSHPNVTSLKLFLIFLKVGAILYGSGYVLFAFLDAELVASGLLTKQQLIDAIAVGQFTPGPVFSSATFIGWQIGGFGGALAATIGIFLPSFLFVALFNPLLLKLRHSKIFSAFLDTVNVASIAIIFAILVEMSRETLLDWRTITIVVLSFAVTYYFKKMNTAFIVIGGALLGYLLILIP